jgi:hypothetical protein
MQSAKKSNENGKARDVRKRYLRSLSVRDVRDEEIDRTQRLFRKTAWTSESWEEGRARSRTCNEARGKIADV